MGSSDMPKSSSIACPRCDAGRSGCSGGGYSDRPGCSACVSSGCAGWSFRDRFLAFDPVPIVDFLPVDILEFGVLVVLRLQVIRF